jgi:guanylate kinase
MQRRKMLLLVTGPSGAGKSSILQWLFERDPRLGFSVSCTTRPPRAGEKDGHDYYFVTDEEFVRRREAGDFVEWAEVHDHFYGTLYCELDRMIDEGRVPVLDIDVQGGKKLVAHYGERVLSVFILPPDPEALETRLQGRGTDDRATIELRLRNARREVESAGEYRYWIVNDDLQRAREDLAAIVRAEGLRSEAQNLPQWREPS